jgi:hypothetical protein
MIDDALALGWQLIPYEDTTARSPRTVDGGIDWDAVNEREAGQARKLADALPAGPLLVWCGNSHLSKRSGGEFTPMGMLFRELTGVDHFALDQTPTILDRLRIADAFRDELERLGGTGGALTSELTPPYCRDDVDAVLFSVDNEIV